MPNVSVSAAAGVLVAGEGSHKRIETVATKRSRTDAGAKAVSVRVENLCSAELIDTRGIHSGRTGNRSGFECTVRDACPVDMEIRSKLYLGIYVGQIRN